MHDCGQAPQFQPEQVPAAPGTPYHEPAAAHYPTSSPPQSEPAEVRVGETGGVSVPAPPADSVEYERRIDRELGHLEPAQRRVARRRVLDATIAAKHRTPQQALVDLREGQTGLLARLEGFGGADTEVLLKTVVEPLRRVWIEQLGIETVPQLLLLDLAMKAYLNLLRLCTLEADAIGMMATETKLDESTFLMTERLQNLIRSQALGFERYVALASSVPGRGLKVQVVAGQVNVGQQQVNQVHP